MLSSLAGHGWGKPPSRTSSPPSRPHRSAHRLQRGRCRVSGTPSGSELPEGHHLRPFLTGRGHAADAPTPPTVIREGAARMESPREPRLHVSRGSNFAYVK